MSISINTIILILLFFPMCTLPSIQLIRACAREPRVFYGLFFIGVVAGAMNSFSTISAILRMASRSLDGSSIDFLASAYIVAMASFCGIFFLGSTVTIP